MEDLNGVIGGNKLISFSLFHLNARSLVKNQDALAHLLANINHKFSVLAITETWVKESNVNDLSFEGYNFVSNHRANKIGGGDRQTDYVRTDYVRTNKKKVVGKSFGVANASIVFHGARTLIIFSKLLFFFLSRKPSLKKKLRKQGCLVFDPGLWC